MSAVVFCNIAWMKRYKGITEDDVPMNGGSFVEENADACESTNFLSYSDGKCYGFVEHGGAELRLERVDTSAVKADVLDEVTVVWVATGPNGNRIVGWYEKASMYRYYQEYEGGPYFYFSTNVTNAYRIPVPMRHFPVPRASKAGKGRGMGQSNVWYADSHFAKDEFIPRVLKYLDEIKLKCRITGFTPQERSAKTSYSNKTDEELVRMACEASNDGDVLKGLQIANQLIAQEEEPCGFNRGFKAAGLEDMLCFDEAIEAHKLALEYFTSDEREAGLDVDSKITLSRLYRYTNKNFLAWHMENEIFDYFQKKKDNAGMVHSLMEMMDIAAEEKDWDSLKKAIDAFDNIGTKYYKDEVKWYRELLNKRYLSNKGDENNGYYWKRNSP